jgi:hypothetical protein
MELNVYSSEKFERGKRWYVILAFIMILVIFMCAYYRNWTWIILMFLILWWYIYLWLINVKEIKMKITDEWLILWDKLIPRTNLTWYVIEINKNDQQIKNIVLLSEKYHSIHTISDTIENVKTFVNQLDNYLPMVWEYNQTNREKFQRVIKL